MGLFDSLFGQAKAVSSEEHRERRAQSRSLEQKSRAITSADVFGATVGDSEVTDYVEEGYQANPYIHRAISLVASSVATLDIGVYDGKERPQRITGEDAAKLIERPNPLQSNSSFMEALVTKLMLNGEVYVEAIGPSQGGPAELYLPDPSEIDPEVDKDADGLIQQYVQETTGEEWSPREMHQIRLVNPENPFRGQSVVKAVSRAGDVSNYGRKYLHALLKANGVPPHLIMLAGQMGPEERENFEDQFAQRTLSAFQEMRADGLPKPQVMQDAGQARLDRIGFSPDDMELLPSMQQAAREVATGMGVAPELLGDPENKVYDNVKQARKALYTETAIPMAEKICGELTHWLGPQFEFDDNRRFYFETEHINALQGDPARKRELDLRELESGAITINEYRQRQGKEPKEGADVLLVPKSKQPLAVARSPEQESEPQPN
ncbi:phage portal protein [Salinibacter ruber]|uniref:phage portal protein n=1 Tax=Salinibacter ruber TaxID=146919 RepID=UPI00216872F2|nr:phage portal protein [Salinibacter ruber]MCS3610986.1 HK97 family phage portal protein [Salinibacter ruber]